MGHRGGILCLLLVNEATQFMRAEPSLRAIDMTPGNLSSRGGNLRPAGIIPVENPDTVFVSP